ncbi:MAG: glycine cleavage system aminomethyltransferase GcvT [Ignavibacteria bacterium]|nr:glycine cleavage system aminomethyltransferase GcvT [Ignavibacteria bacterium]
MKKTKFHELHKNAGAKIVEFAGYEMPVQYSSIIAEHNAVRDSVGVFDVSHMGEIFIEGSNALDFVQYITVNDASQLTPGKVQYSAMCYPEGGIVDDLLIYNISENKYMLVVNAANIEKDYSWMIENNKFDVDIKNLSNDYSLLAVQGPNSELVVQKLMDNKIDLDYYHFKIDKVAGVEMIVSRTGYTGELGYELYFRADEETAAHVWNELFKAGKAYDIQAAGLAARDSLRLEMGFCLYGNDIDETTNTIEAGLGWITKLNKEDFIGRESLKKVKENGITRKLIAMISADKFFPRKGYDIVDGDKKIGKITSGTVSPVLEKPIALGYIDSDYKKVGTEINISIRGKEFAAKVVKLPFVKN